MVGRCIPYWNSPFLGDMLVFWGVVEMGNSVFFFGVAACQYINVMGLVAYIKITVTFMDSTTNQRLIMFGPKSWQMSGSNFATHKQVSFIVP